MTMSSQEYIPIITHFRIVTVQRRKHKKHRINKKWLKRYGMRTDAYFCDELLARDVTIEVRKTIVKSYLSQDGVVL